MVFQKPIVEFVPISAENSIITASCPEGVITGTGGGQRCIGTQIDAQDCADWDSLVPEWLE